MHDARELLEISKNLREFVNYSLDHRIEQNEKPNIVVWGLMNAGKSSLLNMLTGHIEQEFFKTNDIRETAKISKFETNDYIFLDTPGLDGNKQDDEVALKGIQHADAILFVHQLQGEFEQVEIDFLKEVRASFGEHAHRNIVIILSKVDKAPVEDVQKIQNSILEQCQKYLGFQPRCFQISNKYYQIGCQKNKEALIEKSQINLIRTYLKEVEGYTEQVREQRFNHNKNTQLYKLQGTYDAISDLSEDYASPFSKRFKPLTQNLEIIEKEILNFKDEESLVFFLKQKFRIIKFQMQPYINISENLKINEKLFEENYLSEKRFNFSNFSLNPISTDQVILNYKRIKKIAEINSRETWLFDELSEYEIKSKIFLFQEIYGVSISFTKVSDEIQKSIQKKSIVNEFSNFNPLIQKLKDKIIDTEHALFLDQPLAEIDVDFQKFIDTQFSIIELELEPYVTIKNRKNHKINLKELNFKLLKLKVKNKLHHIDEKIYQKNPDVMENLYFFREVYDLEFEIKTQFYTALQIQKVNESTLFKEKEKQKLALLIERLSHTNLFQRKVNFICK